MVVNQSMFSRLIKPLVVEKCKTKREIYRRMYDVYQEVCFS